MRRNSDNSSLESRARDLQRSLSPKYPDLTVSCAGKKIYVRGAFPVIHDGEVLDRYQVEIEWSERDKEAPLLRETAGRIPRIDDRHINKDGEACIFVPEEWLVRPRDEKTLIHYLDGPVRDYFIWQSLCEDGQSLPWKGRSHYIPGLIEAYGEMVGFRGESSIRCCLEYLSKKKIKPHWLCPCGSGKQLRHCHLGHICNLQLKIPRSIAKLAFQRLRNPTAR
jgi:hypothetical protein